MAGCSIGITAAVAELLYKSKVHASRSKVRPPTQLPLLLSLPPHSFFSIYIKHLLLAYTTLDLDLLGGVLGPQESPQDLRL